LDLQVHDKRQRSGHKECLTRSEVGNSLTKEKKWDFRCEDCDWQGLVDECFYDDDNDGMAMCPECQSKNMKLWSKDD